MNHIRDQLLEQIHTDDLRVQQLRSNEIEAELIYFYTMCDQTLIQHEIVSPFFSSQNRGEFINIIESNARVASYQHKNNLVEMVSTGFAILFVGEKIYYVDSRLVVLTKPKEVTVESTVQGTQTALSENLETSINLVRTRYTEITLHVELGKIGTKTKTAYALVYDDDLVDSNLLQEVKQRIAQIDLQVVESVGQVAKKLGDSRYYLFPTVLLTERHDRVALNLSQGKIILLLNGTPFALILPTIFFDFFSTMDDIYMPFIISKFLVFLRYIGLLFSVTLPSVYVVIASYNPEIFRVQLTLSIAGSRAAVPYPSYLEVVFMLLMMELLTEASLRLPKAIGSTATTVGGLILGQAATEAGLVSDIMIILVSAVAISNFVIPINTMSLAMRFVKYPLLIITTLYGLIGLVIGFIAIIGYLTYLESFGHPFLKFFVQIQSHSNQKGKATNSKVAKP